LISRTLGDREAYGKDGLADKLIARRDDLAKQYGL
jgi:hypothetical protein